MGIVFPTSNLSKSGTLRKVPNFESQSVRNIAALTESYFINAYCLETEISETVMSFVTRRPTFTYFLTEKSITWIAFDRQSISDSMTQ